MYPLNLSSNQSFICFPFAICFIMSIFAALKAIMMVQSIQNEYVATIGFFDGVHCGHRFLLENVIETARKSGLQSMVVTFAEHPRKVLEADFQPKLLTTKEEKAELLKATGVERILMLDFTKQVASMTAREFMQMLYEEYGVRVLIVGYDHRFGAGRAEVFDDYHKYGDEMGMRVVKCPHFKSQKHKPDEQGVSSTVIRKALGKGEIKTANELLGHRYMLTGRVVHGFHNGTDLGYPTANIDVEADKLVPMSGVYAVSVRSTALGDKSVYGMLNIGTRPTLENGESVSVEVHIFECNADLYDSILKVEIINFLRREKKFDDVESLKEQLKEDEQQCRRIILSENK